jgi:type IV fimbrial biogenesis protein FimT
MRTAGMPARTTKNRGFTLIEMMIAITVAAILLMIAVPSFRNASLSSQLRSAANDFIASSNFARSEAIKRGTPVTMCVSADGSTCIAGGWEQGWIVLGSTTVGTTVVTTVLQHESAAPSGFKMSATGSIATLSFQPIGVGATPASLTVCRATPSVGSQERVVTLDSTGRAWLKITTTGVCS